jgi:hypothetical protein
MPRVNRLLDHELMEQCIPLICHGITKASENNRYAAQQIAFRSNREQHTSAGMPACKDIA